MSEVTLTDADGTIRFRGTLGGSQPEAKYVLTRTIIDFQETPGAGTYTAEVELPAGAVVWDCLILGLANFESDTGDLSVGDDLNGAGSYYNEFALVAFNLGVYDPATASGAGTGFDSVTNDGDVYKLAALLAFEGGNPGFGIPYAVADTLVASFVTTGAGGSAGHFQLHLIGFGVPGETVAAVKVDAP